MRFSSCGRTTTRPRCRSSGTRSDSRSPQDRVFPTPPLQLNVDADIRRGERSVLEARILQDLAALLFSLERQTSLKQAEVDLHGPVHVDRADEPCPALADGSPPLDPLGPDALQVPEGDHASFRPFSVSHCQLLVSRFVAVDVLKAPIVTRVVRP